MFTDALEQLLTSGEAIIAETRAPEDPKLGVTIVGCQDEQYVYLLWEIAYREAVRVTPLKFSAAAISIMLTST